jgi:hypothetical protein
MAMLTYDDDYPTCGATYATLCIYGDDLDPDTVTSLLGIEPSQARTKGQQLKKGVVQRGGWFLSTEDIIASKDVRCHVDWLIEKITGKEHALHEMRLRDYQTVVSCYWLSAFGHGGPMLSPAIMRSLANLGLEIWFDVYFHGQ